MDFNGAKARGSIKGSAEDFVVEEITENGTVLEAGRSFTAKELGFGVQPEGRFTAFVLQKRDWNTAQALKTVARRFSRGIKSTGFAGTKDRTSVSTQLCSIFGVTPEQVLSTRIKDISINGAWRSGSKVEMGALLGNRFTVTVRDINDIGLLKGRAERLNGIFPNYFGEQRFGYRNNNVEIGVDMMRGDLESAAMRFLTDSTNEQNAGAVGARKRLLEERDFASALRYCPRFLKYESLVLEHLSRSPSDFGGALRMLPRSLTLMFLHSVDAYIFNRELDDRISSGGGSAAQRVGELACMADRHGFPDLSTAKILEKGDEERYTFAVANVLGYESAATEFEERTMKGMGITKEMFKVKSMPELNCRGNMRVLFAPFLNFSCTGAGKDAKLSFSLPAGSYATTLLAELVENREREEMS